MKADEIRKITIRTHGGYPTPFEDFSGVMLQEIAAQLAELNETLKNKSSVRSTEP